MFEEKKAEWLRIAESLKPALHRETVRPVSGMPDHAAAEAFVKEVTRFCAEVGIPKLQDLGVKKEDFFAQLDKMASDALESGSPQNTMRIPTKEQIIEIYKKLF